MEYSLIQLKSIGLNQADSPRMVGVVVSSVPSAVGSNPIQDNYLFDPERNAQSRCYVMAICKKYACGSCQIKGKVKVRGKI